MRPRDVQPRMLEPVEGMGQSKLAQYDFQASASKPVRVTDARMQSKDGVLRTRVD